MSQGAWGAMVGLGGRGRCMCVRSVLVCGWPIWGSCDVGIADHANASICPPTVTLEGSCTRHPTVSTEGVHGYMHAGYIRPARIVKH